MPTRTDARSAKPKQVKITATAMSRETRRILADAARAARAAEPILRDPALVALLLPATVHRIPLVAVSTPAWLAARLDPWRMPEGRAETERASEARASIALRLLDGRRGQLVRVVVDEPGGRRRREIYFESAGIRQYDLSSLLLPLHGIEDRPAQGKPIVVTEGVRATESLRSQGLQAVGTLCGPYLLPPKGALAPIIKSGPVHLWPLPDERGQAHMQQLAAHLVRMGSPTPRIVTGAHDPTTTLPRSVNAQKLLEQAVAWRPSFATPIPRLRLPKVAIGAARIRAAVGSGGEVRMARPATATRLAGARRLAERLVPHLLLTQRDEPLTAEQRVRLLEAARRLYTLMGVPLPR